MIKQIKSNTSKYSANLYRESLFHSLVSTHGTALNRLHSSSKDSHRLSQTYSAEQSHSHVKICIKLIIMIILMVKIIYLLLVRSQCSCDTSSNILSLLYSSNGLAKANLYFHSIYLPLVPPALQESQPVTWLERCQKLKTADDQFFSPQNHKLR